MKKKIKYLVLCLFTIQVYGQNIGINSNGNTPNSSAMLDIDVSGLTTKKGMLIPRVTQTERLAMNPLPAAAQGLMVYQTDGTEGFYYNVSTTTTPNWVFLLPSSTNNGGWGLSGNSGTTAGTNFIGTIDAKDWVVKTNNIERMRFLSSGNLGLGTSTPSYKFDLSHITSTVGDRAFNIDYQPSVTTNSDSTAALFVRTTSRSSGGAVGALFSSKATGTGNAAGLYNVVTGANSGGKIGVSSNISGAGNGLGYGALITNSGGTNYGAYYQVAGVAANYGLYANVTGGFGTSVGVHITGTPDYSAVFESGIVTIGDSLSVGYPGFYVPQYKLDVNGRSNFTKALHFNGLSGNVGDVLVSNGANSAPSWAPPSTGPWEEDAWGDMYNLNAGFVGINCTAPTEQLTVDGNINATGTITANDAFACASDRRYKKDIRPIKGSLQNVLQLQGVSYFWKTEKFPEKKFTEDKQIGFIAQEIEKIYPEMVFTDSKGYKSVDYSRLTPVLVEAVKELNSKVEDLENELLEERKKGLDANELLKRVAALEEILKDLSLSGK